MTSFINIHNAKGFKFDDSQMYVKCTTIIKHFTLGSISTNHCNLSLGKAHLNLQITLEVLADAAEVFDRNFCQLYKADPLTLAFPIVIRCKESMQGIPVYQATFKLQSTKSTVSPMDLGLSLSIASTVGFKSWGHFLDMLQGVCK